MKDVGSDTELVEATIWIMPNGDVIHFGVENSTEEGGRWLMPKGSTYHKLKIPKQLNGKLNEKSYDGEGTIRIGVFTGLGRRTKYAKQLRELVGWVKP